MQGTNVSIELTDSSQDMSAVVLASAAMLTVIIFIIPSGAEHVGHGAGWGLQSASDFKLHMSHVETLS